MKLQYVPYVGTPHLRVISKEDFETAGYPHDEISADPSNNHTIEVSNKVGKWLTEIEPEWQEVADSPDTAEGEGDPGEADSAAKAQQRRGRQSE